MNKDGAKNDSRKILPKINWKNEIEKKSPKNEKCDDKNNKIIFNKLLNFKIPKITIIRRIPTNIHLTNILKPLKEEIKNMNKNSVGIQSEINKSTTLKNVENEKTEIVNINNINLIEREFPMLLKNTKNKFFKSNSNNSFEESKIDNRDIYTINDSNKKEENNTNVISNKLIANRIKSVRLLHKGKIFKKKQLFRNKNISLGFTSSSSRHISFTKEPKKNNSCLISLNKFQDNTNDNISINSLERKKIISPFSKGQKLDLKGLFISKLDIKTIHINKTFKNKKHKNYKKKWDLPKSFSFNKISGRQKEIKNPIKFICLERFFEYNPNYDSILCNSNKAYVKYNHNLKNDFKQYKINSTRKFVCNSYNIMNNPGNNYNILNILNERKMEEEKIYNKKKLDKILEDFIPYHKKNGYIN
jgi:hypothetical protein